MTLGLLFWILMLLSLVWGGYSNRANLRGWLTGGDLVVWILFAVLGWKVFGPAVHQ